MTGVGVDTASVASFIAPEEYSAKTRISNVRSVAVSKKTS